MVQPEKHRPMGTPYSRQVEHDSRKLSRHRQVIQTEWSLYQGIFNQICQRWHTPQIDLFATRFNKKLPMFVSPVLDKEAWTVDTLSLSWKDMDGYAFPQTSRDSKWHKQDPQP